MTEIRIPCEPYCAGEEIPTGVELELTPTGVQGSVRHLAAVDFVRQLRGLLPSRPTHPEAELDFFCPLARCYVEMEEFVEVAGVTCDSPEAVAWIQEAIFYVLSRATVTVGGRPVPLCHTPSDYNNYTSGGNGRAHSTGSHANLLCPRPLDKGEFALLASILCPLNAVFGPGGMTWTDGVPRFTCDPRADHVERLLAGRAHGTVSKPFFLRRDEPLAESPRERIQIVAFGSARSPVSCWLRVELLSWALEAVLHRKQPPFHVIDPVKTLRAAPNASVIVKRRRRHAVEKARLATETVCWLADSIRTRDPASAQRVQRIRELSCAAVASAAHVSEPPVFPTDIPAKQYLFDHIARNHGYADLASLCRACAATPADGRAKSTLDTVIVNDVFFSSPSLNHSTYELAIRCGVFCRPAFEHAVDWDDLTNLPRGVCQRDRIRAAMLVAGDIEYCDWSHLTTNDGSSITMPNPWSDPKSQLPRRALP